MKFLLLSGSFHSNSRSLVVLGAISQCLEGHAFDIVGLDALPYFCEDLNKNKPDEVAGFLAEVEQAEVNNLLHAGV